MSTQAERRQRAENILRGQVLALAAIFGLSRDEIVAMVDEEIDRLGEEEQQ